MVSDKMEEYPQFLTLNIMNKEWLVNHKVSEDTKLELRLGPPGEVHGYNSNTPHGTKRTFHHTTDETICSSKMAVGEVQFTDRKACCTLATADPDASLNNTSNKSLQTSRIAYSPVVGWPPIRSSRKNLAGNNLSKPASESSNDKETGVNPKKPKTRLFVKINMEGIPIGRKVNLGAYNSYEELSLAIDELFSGLLAAQTDPSTTQNESTIKEVAKADAGSLAAGGEYTLIYEDDEGDRVLVGDVPWHMFVSTAKRLHVLKSSEISTP
ncbi:auxin-responsive protein IAA2-like isoform X2 [Hibiscus syriacus]|uniref:auxin-responsive protein IAA2-like isoform X2 n=1 Tax=Hibiscus syriacus TaxID=106335 RepID=UPI001923F133|nr:auxin-responsive protein IAA2-like isoform X2 [Hibiscus syriacus]